MKNLILGLLLGLVLSACAGIVIPSLENRILFVHQEIGGAVFFPYCKKYKWLNRDKCKKGEFVHDVYNLNDKLTRVRLKDFVLVHRSKVF